MKTKSLFLCLIVAGFVAQAQIKIPTDKDIKNAEQSVNAEVSKASGTSIGSLIGQLAGGISDNSLTESFKKGKSDFINQTNKVTDPAGAASALQSLEGGLLPTVMDAGWGTVKDKWIKDGKTANTVKTVAGLAGTLESHIKQSNFKGDWAKARPAWQAALGALAK